MTQDPIKLASDGLKFFSDEGLFGLVCFLVVFGAVMIYLAYTFTKKNQQAMLVAVTEIKGFTSQLVASHTETRQLVQRTVTQMDVWGTPERIFDDLQEIKEGVKLLIDRGKK